MILPDLLEKNLNIIFCGTAAGDKSAEREAYYAGRGNLFYSTLAICGYTSQVFQPEDYPQLLRSGIGLTDLAKLTQGMDYKLKESDYDTISFENKIVEYQPKILCFNGKEAARVYFKLKSTKEVNLGLQTQKINNTKLYVAPSTSFSARKYWNDNYWRDIQLHW